MTYTMNRMAMIVAAAALLAVGLGAGYWWAQRRVGHDVTSTMAVSVAGQPERKVLYWYDPMMPDQHFDKPGKSPTMDMQLVPKYSDGVSDSDVVIAPGVQQNLGVRTAVVKRGQLASDIRVPGTLGWDLRQERVVSARVDAIVERQFVKTPFETVRAGQPLANLIAPAWGTALAEAEALRQADSASARALQSAANQRLHALGMPAGAARGGHIILSSPVDGVVSEIGVREGQSAPTGTLLFRINGNRSLWLEAAVPQAVVAGIKADTPIEASVDARPGETFRGRVENVLPQIDAGSRTQRVRIVLDNPDATLAPGMTAQVSLRPTVQTEQPLVPSEALIGMGEQARVIVLDANGAFHPVAVRTGRSADGMTEIVSGLQGGEKVVASGQFLIDSEASLSGALERLDTNDKAAAPGRQP